MTVSKRRLKARIARAIPALLRMEMLEEKSS